MDIDPIVTAGYRALTITDDDRTVCASCYTNYSSHYSIEYIFI